ncbi:uncharacterized protein CPUR_02537 [Claviceps purpurea 20.1]|uniref:Uncharacterized protein n=1 Tax=Claviceps purpurea (strain 20.1) TaxID=1111077 RepID=M1W7Z7_CLAP2|nr:uncharacterized protein CPUR_02537 [Claviceps purpurea 20.1]
MVHGSSPLRKPPVMVPGSQYNMLVTQRTSSHGAQQLSLNMLVTQRTSSLEDTMSWCTALNIICSSLRGRNVMVHGSQ